MVGARFRGRLGRRRRCGGDRSIGRRASFISRCCIERDYGRRVIGLRDQAVAAAAPDAIAHAARERFLVHSALGAAREALDVVVRAAMDGLAHLTTVEQIARERGIEPSSLPYRSRATASRDTGRARTKKETV